MFTGRLSPHRNRPVRHRRIPCDGGQYADNQIFASEYPIAKEWITRFDYVSPDGYADVVEFKCRVVARETIEVPAGKFDTFRVEGNGWRLDKPSRRMRRYWIAPGGAPFHRARHEQFESQRARRKRRATGVAVV